MRTCSIISRDLFPCFTGRRRMPKIIKPLIVDSAVLPVDGLTECQTLADFYLVSINCNRSVVASLVNDNVHIRSIHLA